MVPLCTLIAGAFIGMQITTPWSVNQTVYDSRPTVDMHTAIQTYAVQNKAAHHINRNIKPHRMADHRHFVSHRQANSLRSIETMATLAPVLSTAEGTAETAHHLAVQQTYQCILTAYGPGFASTGKHPGDPGYGITASGHIAVPQHTVAVDPRLIPLGSLLYIDGIGYRVAEDVGGAIRGQHIDLYFPNDNEAVKFGVKNHVKVFVFAHPSKVAP